MAIKYELQSIKNAGGEGGTHSYVRLRQLPAMTARQLECEIEANTTLKRADVRAVMAELGAIVARELADGHRVYLPEIGYLQLRVALDPTDRKPTARDISISTLRFHPERRLLDHIRGNAKFEKATDTTVSTGYTDGELWRKVADYLAENRYLTLSDMQREFRLRSFKARQWLASFVSSGRLVKEGTVRHPIYFLAE